MIDPNNHIISKSLFAGAAVSIGCYISLLCDISLLSPLLLSIGFLFCIVYQCNLFTDKAGFISDTRDIRRLILVLLLNVFAAFVFGIAIRFLDTSVSIEVDKILSVKLNTDYLQYIIGSIITGSLMSFAIESTNKQSKNFLIPILCVVGFAYTGCPHSIVDSFYYGASTLLYSSADSLILHLLVAIIFNFVGCNLYNLTVKRSLIYHSE